MRLNAPVLATLVGLSVSGACSASCGKPAVVVHPRPSPVPGSDVFVLKVRPDGNTTAEAWETVPLFKPRLSEYNLTTGGDMRKDSSLGYFDYDGGVEVSVTANAVDKFPSLDQVRIRPLSYNIQPTVEGREIKFRLRNPHHNVIVEINGDVFNVLHIWSGSIDHNPISEAQADTDGNLIYFGPGYHELPGTGTGRMLNLTSGQTLYLAAGAVVKGDFRVTNQTDVTIRGRGIIYQAPYDAIVIAHSQNVTVEGISVFNPVHYSLQGGSSKGLTVRDFRTVSATQWGDGIDLFCMQDTLIDGIFLRTSDDSIAMYNHRWDFFGDSKNITIRNAALWADVAHAIHIGIHGNTVSPETMSDVRFENIDIMDHREPQVDFQGAIAINSGDENMIDGVVLDGVRIEDFRMGMMLQMRVTFNAKYNQAPGRGIRNVSIRNLSYNGSRGSTPFMAGYSPERAIDGVEFKNLTINGKHIDNMMRKPGWYLVSDFIPMVVGPNVQNITFVP